MAKKPSIREFVSEDALKFQLYLIKYSNQLKLLEDLGSEAINKEFKKNTVKKITRWLKTLEEITNKNSNNELSEEFKENKEKYLSDVLDKKSFYDSVEKYTNWLKNNNSKNNNLISVDALCYNINYVKTIKSPSSKEVIEASFEKARKDYIEYLENKENKKKYDEEMLEYARNIKLSSSVSKEKFGTLLLLMVKNIATMPSFSGYSSNWKTDFYSNAIEKTLLYLGNFDHKLRSKRSGENSKAFAYVTQICYNAFVNIIIERNKDEELVKDTISLESANLDGVRTLQTSSDRNYCVMDDIENKKTTEYQVNIKTIEELNEKIKKSLEHIRSVNEIIESNELKKIEIEELSKIPENEKNNDYYNYISQLENEIVQHLGDKKITTLKIIKPDNVALKDVEIPEVLDINIIISNKKKKKKKNKIAKPLELKDEEFMDEW